MKAFQKNFGLNFFLSLVLILTIIFFYDLFLKKIWTYQSFNIIKDVDLNYQILITKDDLMLFSDNSYFYFNNEKYLYEVISETEFFDNVILEVILDKEISSSSGIVSIMVPKVKKTLFQVIIESWEDSYEET